MAIHKRTKSDGSTVYSAAYFGPDGLRRVEHVRTIAPRKPQRDHKHAEAAARLRASEQRAKVRNGEWTEATEAKPARRISFDTLCGLYLEKHQSPHHCARVKAAVDYFTTKPAESITPADVERFREYRESRILRGRKLQPETIRKDLTALASILAWGRRQKHVRFEVNPASAESVDRPPRTKPNPRPLSPAEEALLLENCPPWMSRIVRWAIYSGMDRGEIVTLTWHDVNEADGIVSAPRAKTGEPRTVFLNRPLRDVLSECKKVRSIEHPNVMLGRDGKPVTPNAVKLALWHVYKNAGLPHVQAFKRFRHTFGSRVAQSGASEFEVMGLLGHSSPEMARHYVRMASAQLRHRAEEMGETSKTAPRAAHNARPT